MSKPLSNTTELLNKILTTYLATKNKLDPNQYGELEMKFGTRSKVLGVNQITKNSFDNVIQQLKSRGFNFAEESSYYLNIKTDIIRTSINGLKNIQEYCRTNNISLDYPGEALTFTEKNVYSLPDGKDAIVNFDDFNFRIAYALETNVSRDSDLVTDLIRKWGGEKKFYRLIHRYSMTSKDFPLVIDLSIVRESKKEQNSLKESILFNLPEKYEIEVELKNDLISDSFTPDSLDKLLKQISKFVMSGLQGTNYPISYPMQKTTINSYLQLIHGPDYKTAKIQPKDFIGPSSTTLQLANIVSTNKDSNVVNIRNNYTVTEKADGDRKMLYVANNGKIYLITMLMDIQFTGAETNDRSLYNSLLDGEHIKYNKQGQFINLYAAFDIYYINTKDVRELLFTPQKQEDLKTNFRLPLLNTFITQLNAVFVSSQKKLPPIDIKKKIFYLTTPGESIFTICKTLNMKIENGDFTYETDGFIFTPSNLGVGINKPDEKPNNFKNTWNYSLKWKPAKYNTIDFLVTTKKLQTGIEYVGNIFREGLETKALDQIVQYKTLVLRVGYDPRKHGYITNPCEYILTDTLPSSESPDNEEDYKPVQFFPSNPPDSDAGITNIKLELDSSNTKQMLTKNNEIIEDNTIVEFSYNPNSEKQWRWIPLRVRYDKTAELKSGNKQYGNAYHVADNNWHSIHAPVTIDMLTTGENIPDILATDDVYYNSKRGFSHTKAMRDFHNLIVKKKLITSVSQPGNTLIDYAAGKGGDLPKWIEAKLSFVFGLDLSKDNIYNKLDGICARYITAKKNSKIIPAALFVQGNATENIRDKSAIYTEKGKMITDAVFGKGSQAEGFLEKGVKKSFGVGAQGFNISSIQFAIHYMFENNTILHNFLTNVAECTKLDGYFIGSSYDGEKIFKLLKDKKENESVTFWDREEKNKLLEITKCYSADEFPDNISCLGYGIDVLQESINKKFKEYLVNYDYLISVIQNYGFAQLTTDEAKAIGLNSGIGNFQELFDLMNLEMKKDKMSLSPDELRKKYGNAYKMTEQQKNISFLNKYFIFKKVREVDINDIKVALITPSMSKLSKKELQEESSELTEIVEKEQESEKKKTRPVNKLKTKVKLTIKEPDKDSDKEPN